MAALAAAAGGRVEALCDAAGELAPPWLEKHARDGGGARADCRAVRLCWGSGPQYQCGGRCGDRVSVYCLCLCLARSVCLLSL